MHFLAKTTLPAVTLLALVQYCPAPLIAAIGAGAAVAGSIAEAVTVAGVVEGAVIAGGVGGAVLLGEIAKREEVNIDELGLGTAWTDCRGQLEKGKLVFSSVSEGTVRVSGIPPACMTLAGVMLGEYNKGHPVPMGTDIMQFSNLDDEDMATIQQALDNHPSKKL